MEVSLGDTAIHLSEHHGDCTKLSRNQPRNDPPDEREVNGND
jgi:hypothetical protein